MSKTSLKKELGKKLKSCEEKVIFDREIVNKKAITKPKNMFIAESEFKVWVEGTAPDKFRGRGITEEEALQDLLNTLEREGHA